MVLRHVRAYGSNPLALYAVVACLVLGGSVVAAAVMVPGFTIKVMAGALGLYLVVMTVKSILAVEVHDAERAATILYNYNKGKTPGLPDKLRGVFWMSTNAAPELMTSIDGSYWDPRRRMLNLDSGATYNWTYSADKVGWLYWFMLRVSYFFCSELHINFNEDITKATMPLYVCGACPDAWNCDGCWMPMGMIWEMRQDPEDENTWDRDIYLYCNPSKRWEFGSYKLIRIIDGKGNRLPGYADMVEQMTKTSADSEDPKTKLIYSKPNQQIMNGDDLKGNVFFGQEGDPDRLLHRD
mmetsp:Transcript_111904/g.216857  ORF Transcript_111904/g.216857 Transcript_111904/m.216857 type:complete len:296 (-) Transcript_111904:113-1000(-)